MPGLVEVRRAVLDDAETVAEIHVRAWQQTYAHLVDAARLASLDPADRVERWREIIVTLSEQAWVAQLDGITVAWATVSDRDPAAEPRDREVNGIYALASAQGSGVGQALLDGALGRSGAFLWVATDNPRAQAFYRRNGFAPDGHSREYELLGSRVSIERWVR